MRRVWIWVAVAVLVGVSSGCVSLAPEGGGRWVRLGVKSVSFGLDRDVIPVGFHKGAFRAIRIGVSSRPVHFYDLKVHYENGGIQDIPIRAHVSAGQLSPAFDLDGRGRAIEKVVLTYRSETSPRRHRRPLTAKVTVYGLRY